ncbi:MAG: HpcH/HpaI aldolase/citrate lyase family protein [Burkholderiaceae bacterium]
MNPSAHVEPCSMLFVPADSDRFVAKAGQRGADALILDLEDAVARPMKVAARANLAPFIGRLRPAAVPLHVRVNNEPHLLADDVEAALVAGADGLLMPKVDTPEQMVELDLLLHRLEARHQRAPGGITVVALIESPLGLCNALPIARASRRLRGRLFGVEDFGAAMSMESHPDGMTGPAQTMAIAAAAAGLQPMGLPGSVAGFTDLDAYRALVQRARRIGMRGSVCIHPAQVPVLNEVFGGSDAEAERARELLRVFDASVAAGRGAVAFEGRMLDEPIAIRARRFLQRHDALKARRSASHGAQA